MLAALIVFLFIPTQKVMAASTRNYVTSQDKKSGYQTYQGKVAYNALFDTQEELPWESTVEIIERSGKLSFLKNKDQIKKSNEDYLDYVFPGYKEERSKYKSKNEMEKELFGTRRGVLDGYAGVVNDFTEFSDKCEKALDIVAEEEKKKLTPIER